MYMILAVSLVQVFLVYYLLFLIPICMIIYVIRRDPFQSKWMKVAYIINFTCIFIQLLYNILIIEFADNVYYLPFGCLAIMLTDWIFNLVVWGREAYVICKYGGEVDLNELLQSKTKTSSNEEDYFMKVQNPGSANNKGLLNDIMQSKIIFLHRTEQA